MAFAGKQTGCSIKANPTCTGNIYFYPCMQIGKIILRDRMGHPMIFHQPLTAPSNRIQNGKPIPSAAISVQTTRLYPAGTQCFFQCFFTGLHTHFHADRIINILIQFLVEVNQKIIDGFFAFINCLPTIASAGARFPLFRDKELVLWVIGPGIEKDNSPHTLLQKNQRD